MKKVKILLVDDEKEFIMTLAERLELRGFIITVSEDGESGFRCFMQEKFDIVILDLMMPGMNGLEILARIKANRPETPVVLLTGHGSTREGMEGMRLGALDYLMKPLRIEELILKIREAVPEKNT